MYYYWEKCATSRMRMRSIGCKTRDLSLTFASKYGAVAPSIV